MSEAPAPVILSEAKNPVGGDEGKTAACREISKAVILSEAKNPVGGTGEIMMETLPYGRIFLYYRKISAKGLRPREISTLAHGFLREKAAELTGFPEAEFTEREAEGGKPYFAAHPEVHFNLSHSGEYILFGLARQEIGVDIQRMQSANVPRLARRVLSAEEVRQMELSAEPERFFFERFALREAYGKYTGRGVFEGMGEPLGEGWGTNLAVVDGYAAAVFAGRPMELIFEAEEE